MLIIHQGKPVTNRFKLFAPVSFKASVNDEILCRHPVTKIVTRGLIYGIITEQWIKIPDWICLEAYNMKASEIKCLLENKFPEHRNQNLVKILLILQIDNANTGSN